MRASQIFSYLEADEAPSVMDAKHYYTHIDAVSREQRARLNRLRRESRKQGEAYREYEQGDLVQLSDAGRS